MKAMDWLTKVGLAGLVVLMGAVFFWQPIKATFSGTTVVNDFVLESSDGALDTKAMRGKVLALTFGYARCGEPCAERLGRAARAYELLTSGERSRVAVILISVDDRDTPAAIAAAAKKAHPDFIGASGKPEQIKAVADAFGVNYQKHELSDGTTTIGVSPMIFVVDADGKFASVISESTEPEKIAASLRAKLPAAMPAPSR